MLQWFLLYQEIWARRKQILIGCSEYCFLKESVESSKYKSSNTNYVLNKTLKILLLFKKIQILYNMYLYK